MRTGIKFVKCCLLTAALSALVLAVFSGASAQTTQTTVGAQVPVTVNVAANVVFAPITGVGGTGTEGTVTANAQKTFDITLSTGYTVSKGGAEVSGVSYLPSGKANAGARVKYSRGNVTLNLSAQSYKNAVISLYSVNGRRVLSGSASASKGQAFSISRNSVPAGVYLLSVRGADGNSFAARLTHGGGRLNVSAAFAGMDNAGLNKSAEAGDYGRWTITVSAEGYHTQIRTFEPDAGANPVEEFTLIRPAATAKANFTETITVGSANVSFDMVYVPGGMFTIGCEASSGCPNDAKPVSGVTVSNYYIGKTEVTVGLWNAVMGITCTPDYRNGVYCPSTSDSYTSMTWFDAMEFACKLSELTGRNYRMPTEAEWEYAAKKFDKTADSLQKIRSGEEWAYNSWSNTHAGGTDPVGPGSGLYTQKTRRDAQSIGTVENTITGRLIRSVEGKGPALRLAISADTDYPPTYVNPCYLHMPEMGAEPENSYRDMRWVTGSDSYWGAAGSIAIGSFELRVWEDGTARLGSTSSSGYPRGTDGQWFTSNNIAFVFVPSSGSSGNTKYAYIFLDASQGSIISDKDFMSGGYIGRIERKDASSSYAKPTISGLMSGKELAQAQANFATEFKMWDMVNIPEAAKQQDPRLLDGPNVGWFQDNRQAGGVHHYRKDVDADEFRFTVNQLPRSRTMLANGAWFTLNNTFLRVTHPNNGKPYSVDYLYAVTKSRTGDTLTFYHNSFMAYERGDFRMFKKVANAPQNASLWSTTCDTLCSGEIPKGLPVSMYAPGGYMDNGHSTFVPAPCPAGGCQ